MSLANKAGWFGTLAAVAVMSGCFVEAMSSREALTDAVREYNDSVQWGNFQDAAAHIDEHSRDRFVEREAQLENELEFSGYEVQRINLDAKTPKIGIVRVQYEWTLKHRGLLERTSTEQRWEKKGMKWVRVAEYRIKGSPLSLFDERVAPAKVAAPAATAVQKIDSPSDKSTPAP